MSVHLPVPLPWLLPYSDVAVLLMRLLVGAMFVTSGWSHVEGSGHAREEHRPATRRSPGSSAWPRSPAGSGWRSGC